MRDFRLWGSHQKRWQLISVVLSLQVALATEVVAQPTTSLSNTLLSIKVRGNGVASNSWTVKQLQKLGLVQTIHTTLKGKPYVARGVWLWDVLHATPPRFNPRNKHDEAQFVVLARGRDGYTAAFAWPELMPQVGNKAAFLIWEADGKPLAAKEGAFRLIVPGDHKPIRWVYNLASIEIYNGQRLGATW